MTDTYTTTKPKKVEAADLPTDTNEVEPPKKRKGYTKIYLERGEDIPPTGVPVSLNGRAYLIQAGVEVEVPTELLEVLDQAEMSEPEIDPTFNQVVGYRPRKRYPYRIVG